MKKVLVDVGTADGSVFTVEFKGDVSSVILPGNILAVITKDSQSRVVGITHYNNKVWRACKYTDQTNYPPKGPSELEVDQKRARLI